MAQASEHSGHDRARGRQAAAPPPNTLKEDLDAIERYVKTVKDRRKAIRDRRKALEGPPRGMPA